MWPLLAGITRSNRGRKLLPTFLAKPFYIDFHAWFTEALSSSVFLWRVLQAFSSLCVRKLKSRDSNVVTVGVIRRSVHLEDVSDFLVIFLTQGRLFISKNFCVNGRVYLKSCSYQTGGIFSMFDAMTFTEKIILFVKEMINDVDLLYITYSLLSFANKYYK